MVEDIAAYSKLILYHKGLLQRMHFYSVAFLNVRHLKRQQFDYGEHCAFCSVRQRRTAVGGVSADIETLHYKNQL